MAKWNLWTFLRATRSHSERIWFEFVGSMTRNLRLVEPDPSAPRFFDSGWGRVAVIGRSESAREILRGQERFDVIILCNFRDTDLKDPSFVQYLSGARAVYIVASIEEPVFSLKTSRRIPIAEVIWVGFMDGRMPARKRARGKLSKLGMPVRGLPADFDERWIQSFGSNTGLTAIRLAALRSQRIDIFGIEFYQNNFLMLTDHDKKGFGVTRPEYGLAIKKQFEELVRNTPQVLFTIHCSNLAIGEYSNLHVLDSSRL